MASKKYERPVKLIAIRASSANQTNSESPVSFSENRLWLGDFATVLHLFYYDPSNYRRLEWDDERKLKQII